MRKTIGQPEMLMTEIVIVIEFSIDQNACTVLGSTTVVFSIVVIKKNKIFFGNTITEFPATPSKTGTVVNAIETRLLEKCNVVFFV